MSEGHIPFDDSNASVYRVLGPPGTGKTTYLVDQAERAAQKYGCDNVRVVSMTQTASKAFAKKNSIIPSENVSTLHALAYRAIGRPGVFGKDEIERWNSEYPGYALSGIFDPIDGPMSKTFGDALLMDVEMARAKRIVPGYAAAKEFSEFYERFKLEVGRVDFTGMLEAALMDIDFAPGRPEVLLVDEGQDLSTLELALVEKWASRCKALVIVGDSDQSLYSWRGADPRVLIVEGQKPFNIRDQSYRVPRAVQAHAMEIIQRSSTWSKAEYAPKRQGGKSGPVVEGEVSRIPSYFDSPGVVLDDVEVEVVNNPLVEDAMILAQCGYMLSPIAAELKARGIGYCNPYRNEWNPLARGGSKKVTGADKVLAFARLSTPRDWRIALSCLAGKASGGPLIHGAKAKLELFPDDASMADVVALIPKVLSEGAYELFDHGGSKTEATTSMMAKFYAACSSVAKESMRFAERVYQRDGSKGVESPKVILGTIHSTKGGEAEHVYLSAELSPQARKQKDFPGWDGADSVWRTFYVGATRAKHRLVICGDYSPRGAGI